MDYFDILIIKPKYKVKFIIMIIILIVILLFLFNFQVSNTLKLKGIINNNEIILNLPVKYSDTLIDGKFIKINNTKYLYKITNISPIKIDEQNMINYQTIHLKINEKLYQNQIIDITMFFQKEKLINKIKRICIERSENGNS